MTRILAAMLAMLPAAVAAGEAPPAGWDRLFSDNSPTEAIEKVLAGLAGDPTRTAEAIRTDAAYAPFKPGWLRRADRVAEGETAYELTYHVRVPRDYTPEKPWPLLLAAHGQGSIGPHIGRMMEWALGAEVEKYVIVAPTLPGPQSFNGRGFQEQAWLKPLAWVRRNLNIDDDRVFVSGYSMGGHCAWHLAAMFPQLFAAALPMAGVPTFEGSPYTNNLYLSNLSNLPVWAIWGELDAKGPGVLSNVHFARAAAEEMNRLGNDKFTGEERAGAGHAGCFPKPGETAKYFAAHSRRAVPEKVNHAFHLPAHARGYYVEAVKFAHDPEDFSKVPKIRLKSEQPSTDEVIAAGRAHYEKGMFRVEAELDRAGNALTVRTAGVTQVRIYVMEGMFDLSKPVTLRFDRRSWTGRIVPSGRCMLTHYAATRDATALVVNEVDLDGLGRATVRYGGPADGAK